MELVIYTPQEDQFIKAIDFNFEEIRQEMSSRLAKYDGLIYTEDNIKDAKIDRAALNKFKEAIEAKRKEVKKQCLAPYEEFEKKIKELTALIDAPVLAIDGQVKAFEQAQKDEKRAQIKTHYDDHIGDLATLLPFDRLFSDRWLNATVKLKEACAAIDTSIERTTSDLQTIDGLKSEFGLQIKDTYLKTLDLSAALREKERLEAAKAAQEEYRQRMEVQEAERKARAAEAPQTASEVVQTVENMQAQTVPVPRFIEPEAPIVRQVDFRVWVTDKQLASLGEYMKLNNIKYGRVI